MTLLEECLKELVDYEIYSEVESVLLFDKLVEIFPFTRWGRIDWNKMVDSFKVEDIIDLLSLYKDQQCYLFWDSDSLPVIKTTFCKVIGCLESVTAVSFDTWLVNSSFDCVIEFYHEGEIMTGCNKVSDIAQ